MEIWSALYTMVQFQFSQFEDQTKIMALVNSCNIVHTNLCMCLVGEINLYITKSWNVAYNVVALTLCHISDHVIPIFFSFNLSYNFKIVFTNFRIIVTLHNKSQPYNKSQPISYLFSSTIKPNSRLFQLKGKTKS